MEEAKLTYTDIKKIIKGTTTDEMTSGVDMAIDSLGCYFCENGDKRTGIWFYATNNNKDRSGKNAKGIWKHPEVQKELKSIDKQFKWLLQNAVYSLENKMEEVSETDRVLIESFPEYEDTYRSMTRHDTKDEVDPVSEVPVVGETG